MANYQILMMFGVMVIVSSLMFVGTRMWDVKNEVDHWYIAMTRENFNFLHQLWQVWFSERRGRGQAAQMVSDDHSQLRDHPVHVRSDQSAGDSRVGSLVPSLVHQTGSILSSY
jgi:hypothetical protein